MAQREVLPLADPSCDGPVYADAKDPRATYAPITHLPMHRRSRRVAE